MNKMKWIQIVTRLLITTLLFSSTVRAETITYFYKDVLGSTIVKADENGDVIWRESHEPYGKSTQLSEVEIAETPLQYTNAPLDEYTGLTYLKARYYNGDIGRFYALDPLHFRDDNIISFNRYAYANNNPYKYVDPTGEAEITAGRMGVTPEKSSITLKIDVKNFADSTVDKIVSVASNKASPVFSAGSLTISILNQLSTTVKPQESFNSLPSAVRAQHDINVILAFEQTYSKLHPNNKKVSTKKKGKPIQLRDLTSLSPDRNTMLVNEAYNLAPESFDAMFGVSPNELSKALNYGELNIEKNYNKAKDSLESISDSKESDDNTNEKE